jgi:RNA polymerase sigma factor (sigma-70 family)
MEDHLPVEAATATRQGAPLLGRITRSVPDGRLVARLRAGDERAFEGIYDRYHRELLGFCRHMVGTREEAEDVLQHVMVSAHRHLLAGDADVTLRPWLYAIARNRCISVLRARRESVALEDVPEPSGDGLAVAAEVEQRADLREMLGDLARLPDDQRAALVLAELGALSHDEIAEALDVRREKVKALVFQARESLSGWRSARDTDCTAIREQLANLRGGALRRGPLRKHLDVCEGCRDFRSEVRRQREAMALLLPVIPTVALKAKVLGAIVAGGSGAAPVGAGVGGAVATAHAAAGSSAAGSAAAVGGGMAAKALVVAAIAGVAGGGYAIVHETAPATHGTPPPPHATPAAGHKAAAPATVAPSATAPATPATDATRTAERHAAGKAEGHANRHGAAKPTKAVKTHGRPAVPGANGLAHAPKAQGLAHRRPDPPAHGANGTQPGHSGAKSHSKAATPLHPAHPAHPVKPSHPARPKPAAHPAPAGDAGADQHGNAYGHDKKSDGD